MKRLLLAGALDATSQTFVRQLSVNDQLAVTVYTPTQVQLPAGVVALTAEDLDEGGLTAAMLDQDLVVALVPTIHLAQMATTLATAVQAAGNPQLLISRTDDIDELPLEERRARQTLLAAGVAFDLVDGFGGIGSRLGIQAEPAAAFTADDDVPRERFAG